MLNDYLDPRNAEGMPKLVDASMAMTFLLNVKSGVRNYSIALTETTSQEVRTILRKQLGDAIATFETISNYMMKKGYYRAYNMQDQYKVDMQVTETALNLANNMNNTFFKNSNVLSFLTL